MVVVHSDEYCTLELNEGTVSMSMRGRATEGQRKRFVDLLLVLHAPDGPLEVLSSD